MPEGVLAINKEEGFTSMDVSALLRGITKQKRIVHTGTLDPMATGVLPICFGRATKLSNALMEHEKEYEAVALFGVTTNTQDITGEVLKSTEDFSLTADQLEEALQSFVPGYDQLPPMYSARKVKGQKLYVLARKGQTVERQPKWADIPSITLEGFDGRRAKLTIVCGKGTYIRTLIHDLGKKLGMGACMEALTRTRVGEFSLQDAVTIKEFEARFKNGDIDDLMIPFETIRERLESMQ